MYIYGDLSLRIELALWQQYSRKENNSMPNNIVALTHST